MAKRPLHKDSPMAEWDAAALELNRRNPEDEPLTGEAYRAQVMLADEILEEVIREEAALVDPVTCTDCYGRFERSTMVKGEEVARCQGCHATALDRMADETASLLDIGSEPRS